MTTEQYEWEKDDVVIFKVNGREITSYGRDTLTVAKEFCRDPKWPAKRTDSFVGADEYGHGAIVCATPEYSNWIGKPMSQFRREAH